MEVADYTITDFLRDMGRPLQYREPTTTNNDMWVFWSQEEGEGEGGQLGSITETLTNNNSRENVQEYLKFALCNTKGNNRENIVIIQFWAPAKTTSSTIGEHCVLKTSDQPFALYRLERGLCEYRKRCTSLEFNIFQDEEEKVYEDDFASRIGRVFRNRIADSFEGDLLADFAHKCGVRSSFLLPLFKPSGPCCSGILELVYTSKSRFRFFNPWKTAQGIFKEANLIKPPHLKFLEHREIEEINKALQVVCITQQLPLAQIWTPCCTSTAMAYVDSPGERCHSPYLSCSNKFSFQNGDANFHDKMEGFNRVSKRYGFRTGQGIVGKALLYHKPCFCRDVTQLPKAEYPFSLYALSYGLTGCCAIWLHSTRTKNHDYVLEFFLPPWSTISGDLQRYLELLLATVRKQLPGFKISSVGEESCVEVCEVSVNYDEPYSVIISQSFSVKPVPESFANEKEMVQDEAVGETIIDNGSNIFGLVVQSKILK